MHSITRQCLRVALLLLIAATACTGNQGPKPAGETAAVHPATPPRPDSGRATAARPQLHGAGGGAVLVTRQAADVAVVIDAGVKHQRIDGFGSSQRIWGDPHLASSTFASGPSRIPAAAQDDILRRLYGELGLTRVRAHGFCGIEPANDDGDPFSFNPAGFQFIDGPVGACPVTTPPPGFSLPGTVNATSTFVRQAMPYGLRTVLVWNNIPGWMNRSMTAEYAENTLALLLHIRDAQGFEPEFVILQNEPALYAGGWPDGEWHRDVIKFLGPRMRAAGLSTKVVAPDDVNTGETLRRVLPILEDAEARQYLGAIATHLYGDSLRDNGNLNRLRELSQRYGIPLWMTEFTITDRGWEAAFAWASWMHELLATYGFSAVDYMWGFMGDWVYQSFNEEDYIQIRFDHNGNYIGHEPSAIYYAAGQFTRYVRPGAERVEARPSDARVRVTAFLHPTDGAFTVVLINDDASDLTVDVSIANQSIQEFSTVYRTSQTERWSPLPPVAVSGGGFQLRLSARSITTLTTAR